MLSRMSGAGDRTSSEKHTQTRAITNTPLQGESLAGLLPPYICFDYFGTLYKWADTV